ncbi:LysR family transcriptional regulator [Pseudomonas sp. dw_358]|uniref:LysR family transcriptional regulator n=1 Tax=Pseudomonas sp. dw_358 TaxID=2720083 RepID=UPI001BD4929F|nr:LysR family transcriptional regulator [Pseudomonas sp. dw_358]
MLGNFSDLDLRLVRTFLAVVDAQGLTAAQSKLNVSQSAISLQLSTLETRLGFRLCERGRGGFRLTGKGDRFVDSARRMLEAVDAFSIEARNMDKQLVGTLKLCMIGNTMFAQNVKISEAIDLFMRRDQAVNFDIQVKPPGEIEESIMSGRLDAAIGYFWHRAPGLDYTSLFTERQYAYCGKRHELYSADAQSPDKSAISQLRWVTRHYPVPEATYGRNENQQGAIADNMEAAALLIMSGHYVGYLPEHFAEPYVRNGFLRPAAPDLLKHDVTFHLVHKRISTLSEIAKAFLTDLKTVYS